MNTGWLLAGFVPHSTTRSLSITSCSEQVDAATPMVSFRPTVDGAWQHAGGRVDARDAHRPRRLAGHVVRLVRDAPAGEVDRHALGRGRAQRRGEHVERLVPRDAAEPGLAAPAAHRVGEPAEAPELGGACAPPAGATSASTHGIERVGGVELEQLEPGGAEVDAVDRPVVEAGDAEGAAVARALAEHVDGVLRVRPVGPRHLRHVAVVVRLLRARRRSGASRPTPTAASR